MADYTRSVISHSMVSVISNGAGATAALNTLNPFVDTSMYPLVFPATAADDWLYVGASFTKNATLRFSGPLFALPAGKPTLTVGLEGRREGNENIHTYSITRAGVMTYNNHFRPSKQKIRNAYIEMNVPVINPAWKVPMMHLLDLQLTGRADRYESPINTLLPDPGYVTYTSENATFGLRYRPVRDVMLRASYATAFLPPYAASLRPPVLSPTPIMVTDPDFTVAQGNRYNVQRYSGGNPDLKPQSSESVNIGLIYDPQEGPLGGMRLNLEYYQINQKGALSSQQPQFFVDNEDLFPDRVVRDPVTGRIISVNASTINLFRDRSSGYNVGFEKLFATAGLGTFQVNANATFITAFDKQVVATLPFLNYLNYVSEGGPGKRKMNASLYWDRGPWSGGWTATYYGEYFTSGALGSPNRIRSPGSVATYDRNILQQGSQTIPSQLFHDMYARYMFPKTLDGNLFKSILAGASLQLNIRNVLDKEPVFQANQEPYYVSTYGNIRMRSYILTFRRDF